ncbi:MAG: GNAT family N-acetyltransferase [Candidatus Heimdallarchaeota archaeon]
MNPKETKFSKKVVLKRKFLRSLFLSIEKDKEKGKASDLEKQILEEGMVYVQMRLPVDKITKKFESQLKEKIEHNIFHANIREATEKDLQTIVDIYNKSWLTANTPFRPIARETMKKIFADSDTVFLIARVYGIDGAFVILDFEGEHNEYGIIAGLGVLPRFQRKGLGTVLGLAAWEYFKNKGVKELRCEVYKGNERSFNFIKGLNFEIYGEKAYHKSDFELENT